MEGLTETEAGTDANTDADIDAEAGTDAGTEAPADTETEAGTEAGTEAPGDTEAPAGLPPPTARTWRIVRVVSVDVALPDQFPVVTLEDAEGRRDQLAFRIGISEGVALAHAIGGTAAPRPLTHDLFAQTLERYGIDVVAVRLTGRVGATYFAELVLVGPVGRVVLSCRPSDGICLALRQRVPAPVLCDERLFTLGVDVPPQDSSSEDPTSERRAG